ncbi:MAG: alanine racemase, partial [Bacteroidales bacterium]
MRMFPERRQGMNLEKNLSEVKKNLTGQTIIAATKYVEADTIRSLFHLGISDMGENHVQALLQKQPLLSDLPIRWHFIGHLQTNKVKQVINQIDFLHSLDSLKLAAAIQKFRKTPLDCFIEINISHETAKTGMNPEELTNFVHELAKYD